MNVWLHVFLVLLAIPFSGGSTQADEPKSKNYVLFPIKTDLQRTLLFSTRADAYALFDVGESVHEGKFDSHRFDKEGFRKELATLAQQVGTGKPSLQIYFRYAGVSLDPKETKAMEHAVTAMCRQAGFLKVGTGMTYEGEVWQDKVAKFASLLDGVDATESPVEDEFLRVYPVRTKLSRFLLGDADYDCYIESKEDVDKYVRDKGLTHPIALMGGKVAEEKYTVASYPVTYLVDSAGAIVDYHLGFEPGDEKFLAAAVVRLLAERENAADRK